MDEIGRYDVKAALDRVLLQTGQQAIYIGYSMSSKAALIYGTTYPHLAQYQLKALITLGPTVFYINSTTIFNLQIPFMKLIRVNF